MVRLKAVSSTRMLWAQQTGAEKVWAYEAGSSGKTLTRWKDEHWYKERSGMLKSRPDQLRPYNLVHRETGHDGTFQRGSSRGKTCGPMNHSS